MRAAIAIAAVTLTGCNAAIVRSIGAHKTTPPPLISKTSAEPPPCPNTKAEDSDRAIIIVTPRKEKK